jgi:uncharacterized protein YecT (DUF1311 family)|tara:strand:+ start:29513 stop:29860 length:348 start_codon:yes stop_codon:yes gene_type:complete
MANNNVQNCESTMDSNTEVSRCLDSVREKKDRELQTWINNQTFILEELSLINGRSTSLDMFKRSQQNFITYRENNCRWQYLVLTPDESAAIAYKKCYITLTQDRIEELTHLNKQN